MPLTSFNFAATPHIHFGVGKRRELNRILKDFGSKVLLISGAKSFDSSVMCQVLFDTLDANFTVQRERVESEPTPQMIDDWVAKYQEFKPDVVLAIGGGSAVDAGKAVAGLLPSGDSVMAYLEGVGEGKIFHQPTTAFIAVPTTAGTGGETSKNAVLSCIGTKGYKKSFRHESLVAKHIILDPELTISCSSETTARCGMDAFTQLLESFVSTRGNVMTDALAWSGLERVASGLLPAFDDGLNIQARADMLYASSVSGLTLANAGLGSVHGLASPLGAFFPIPHGAVCGSLLFEATKLNIESMVSRDTSNPALDKYAKVGRLLLGGQHLDDVEARSLLLGTLEIWQSYLKMPDLSNYGVKEADIDKVIDHISNGSMVTNPIKLERSEIFKLLQARL